MSSDGFSDDLLMAEVFCANSPLINWSWSCKLCNESVLLEESLSQLSESADLYCHVIVFFYNFSSHY
jgi:hypothetical protein